MEQQALNTIKKYFFYFCPFFVRVYAIVSYWSQPFILSVTLMRTGIWGNFFGLRLAEFTNRKYLFCFCNNDLFSYLLARTQKTQCLRSSQYWEKFCLNKVCTAAVYLDSSSYKRLFVELHTTCELLRHLQNLAQLSKNLLSSLSGISFAAQHHGITIKLCHFHK